jgi:hypothetical protein
MIRQQHRHPNDEGDVMIVDIMVCTETEYHAVAQVIDVTEWSRSSVDGKVVLSQLHWEEEGAEVKSKEDDEDDPPIQFRVGSN